MFAVFLGLVGLIVGGISIISTMVRKADQREATQLALLAPAVLPPGPTAQPPTPAPVTPLVAPPPTNPLIPPAARPGRIRRFFTNWWVKRGVGALVLAGLVRLTWHSIIAPAGTAVADWFGKLRHSAVFDSPDHLAPDFNPQPAFDWVHSVPWIVYILIGAVALMVAFAYYKQRKLALAVLVATVGLSIYYWCPPEYYRDIGRTLAGFWQIDRDEVREFLGMRRHTLPSFLMSMPLMGWVLGITIVTIVVVGVWKKSVTRSLVAGVAASGLVLILSSLDLSLPTEQGVYTTINSMVLWTRTLPPETQFIALVAAVVSLWLCTTKRSP